MTGGGIFVIQPDDTLVRMEESRYDSEDLLQTLLAKYPDLLAGDQLQPAEPRRWLLVTREAAIPDQEGAAGRWSLDHLFLDQDGVPTLVEVKRSTDTRIRREIVGQMLDYAANALLYWPVSTIQALFQAHCEQEDSDPDDVLGRFLGPDGNADDFWARVKTNLEARKVRLLFVADAIPVELQRVIEFLNDQMSQSEVLGIEVHQYVGKNLRTLVPRVVGRTARKTAPGSAGPSERSLRYQRFFEAALAEFKRRPVTFTRPHLSAPRPVNWYQFSAGRGSFIFAWTINPDRRARVELYISGPSAKQYFQALQEQRESIEATLGPVEWERLDQKQASRLAVYHDVPDDPPFEENAALIEWAVDTMVRWNEALRPKLKTLSRA